LVQKSLGKVAEIQYFSVSYPNDMKVLLRLFAKNLQLPILMLIFAAEYKNTLLTS